MKKKTVLSFALALALMVTVIGTATSAFAATSAPMEPVTKIATENEDAIWEQIEAVEEKSDAIFQRNAALWEKLDEICNALPADYDFTDFDEAAFIRSTNALTEAEKETLLADIKELNGLDAEMEALYEKLPACDNIDVQAEQQYYAPKKSVHELVHMESWSNKSGLDEMMDFYDDMLWQAFYAASLSPSYLNRQPYGFLVRGHSIYLVQQEDAYTDNLDAALDLGIVLLHFSAVASQWAGRVRWELSPDAPDGLPAGHRAAAVCRV